MKLIDAIRELFRADSRTLHIQDVRRAIDARYPGRWLRAYNYVVRLLNDLVREGFLVKSERGCFRRA
jgi:DNA-binding PadR family transcriptional regulator